MGSSSRSSTDTSTSSTVNQDIFGIDASGNLDRSNIVGGNQNLTNQEILDMSSNIEDNSDSSINDSFNTTNLTNIDARDNSNRSTNNSGNTTIDARDNSNRSTNNSGNTSTVIDARDNSDSSIRNSNNTIIEGARNTTNNAIDARDQSDRSVNSFSTTSIDGRDQSDRSVNSFSSTSIDGRDLSNRSVNTTNSTRNNTTINQLDGGAVRDALAAIERNSDSAFNFGGEALKSNSVAVSRALQSVDESNKRSIEAVERSIFEVSDALEGFGNLTYDLALKDAQQTGTILKASRSETSQGFDQLTKTMTIIAAIVGGAVVLGGN
jgi:hypothetical protein